MSKLKIDNDDESILSNHSNQHDKYYSSEDDPENNTTHDDNDSNDSNKNENDNVKSSYELFNVSNDSKKKKRRRSKESLDTINNKKTSNKKAIEITNSSQVNIPVSDPIERKNHMEESKDSAITENSFDNKLSNVIKQSSRFIQKFIDRKVTPRIMSAEDDIYTSNDTYLRNFLKDSSLTDLDRKNLHTVDSDDEIDNNVIKFDNIKRKESIEMEFSNDNLNNKEKCVRLFNLPYKATEREIMLFAKSKYVKATSVNILKDRVTNQPNGSAILHLASDEIIDEVVNILHRRYFAGREIRVEKDKDRRSSNFERYFNKSLL